MKLLIIFIFFTWILSGVQIINQTNDHINVQVHYFKSKKSEELQVTVIPLT